VDITRPSVARVYDFYLGGSHNFEADRTFGQTVVDAYPALLAVLRENRAFLRRAVRHLARAGVDQFLDLGSGIPTVGNVHEIAQAENPGARVVYVDHDPVAVTQSREILGDRPRTCVLVADFLDAERVLDAAEAVGGLDLGRPVGVLAVSVLHFVPDDREPAAVMARYLDAAAPGSHLAISHTRSDGEPEAVPPQQLYRRERSLPSMHPRTTPEIAALFGDLHLIDPGLVPVPQWRSDVEDTSGNDRPVRDDHPMLAGVGRWA
jgi:SAM-dependent methyltransferase